MAPILHGLTPSIPQQALTGYDIRPLRVSHCRNASRKIVSSSCWGIRMALVSEKLKGWEVPVYYQARELSSRRDSHWLQKS
jgi:hypothetical protein